MTFCYSVSYQVFGEQKPGQPRPIVSSGVRSVSAASIGAAIAAVEQAHPDARVVMVQETAAIDLEA